MKRKIDEECNPPSNLKRITGLIWINSFPSTSFSWVLPIHFGRAGECSQHFVQGTHQTIGILFRKAQRWLHLDNTFIGPIRLQKNMVGRLAESGHIKALLDEIGENFIQRGRKLQTTGEKITYNGGKNYIQLGRTLKRVIQCNCVAKGRSRVIYRIGWGKGGKNSEIKK